MIVNTGKKVGRMKFDFIKEFLLCDWTLKSDTCVQLHNDSKVCNGLLFCKTSIQAIDEWE